MAGNGISISGHPHDRNGPMVDCPLLDDFIHANNFPRTSPQNFNLTDQVSSVANVATQPAKNSNSLKLRVGGGRRREGARGLRRLCVGLRAALGGILGGVFGKDGDTGEFTRQMYSGTVTLINKMEPEISTLSDSQLRERTSALQERARNGDSLDSLLPEAFAVVREASKRENSRPSPF